MWFKTSITARLQRLIVVSVGSAILLGAVVALYTEFDRYGVHKRDSMLAIASAFAAAAGPAVAAGDREGVFEAVRGVAALPDVTGAEVVDTAGRLIEQVGSTVYLENATVVQRGDPIPLADLVLQQTTRVAVPIIQGGTEVGRLVLVVDTSDLFLRILDVFFACIAVAVLAISVGIALSMHLQQALTRPLVHLGDTMARVRDGGDYEAACPVESDDEIGRLAESFNAMLGEIRRRDARLAQQRDRLELEVEHRTHDLKEAKEIAENASRAKSSFLATMSHEIRTPMNGMLVMAELLAAGDLPDRQRRYAEVIARSGQSLLAIINDILDMAKVEAGKLELEAIPVDLGEVAETVVTLFGERAATKELDLAAAVDPATPGITGDPVRLTQVVSNLVNNALKFTESGHVLVRIGPVDGALEIAVEDTGIGIPADKLPTIFSAFSQADQSTTRRYGGTGLGLSIVEKLVAAMDGEIAVTSTEGKGSTFRVRLPLPASASAPVVPKAEIGRSVVVAAAGGATREALRRGLSAHGLRPASERERGIGADWVLDASALVRAGARPEGARRVVALAPMGERAGEEALARGLADMLIRRPLAQSEWAIALACLATGAAFPAPSDRARSTTDTLPRFGGARVLVADDSAVNREVALEALARFGITADVVEDGRAAVEATAERAYDLVLMDGSMPVMDGFDAARAIRAREAETGAPRLAIVALTAHVVGDALEAWRTSGMDGVLHKPFTLPKLGEILSTYLEPSTGAVAEAEPVGAVSPEPTPVAPEPTDPGETALVREETPADDGLLDDDTITQIAEMAAMSGAGFVGRILRLYREHAPPAAARLVEAVAAGEPPDAVAAAAHSLKSMSLNIGAARLAQTLAAIEDTARDGAVPDAETVGRVEPLLRETLVALGERFVEGEEDGEVEDESTRAAVG